jgi:hypothetical protein
MCCAGDWIRSERRFAGPVHTGSTHLLLSMVPKIKYITKYSRTPLIWINWDTEPSGYAENPDNLIFSFEIILRWQLEVRLLLFNSMYLSLNLSATPDLEF